MSIDWVLDIIERRDAVRAAGRAEVLRVRRAEAEAQRLFREIGCRVKADVERYQAAVGNQSLRFENIPSGRFIVWRSEYPAVELRVEVRGETMNCSYSYRRCNAATGLKLNRTLYVYADSSGNAQVLLGARVFGDPSEISKELLTRLFHWLP